MKTYTYNCFGEEFEVQLSWGRYQNGSLALQLVSPTHGPIAKASSNVESLVDEPLPEGVIAVKDYSENKGMLEFLQDNKIVGPIQTTIRAGHAELYVCAVLVEYEC